MSSYNSASGVLAGQLLSGPSNRVEFQSQSVLCIDRGRLLQALSALSMIRVSLCVVGDFPISYAPPLI